MACLQTALSDPSPAPCGICSVCSRRGTITAKLNARAVAFADDPGWSDELAEFAASNSPVIPPELLEGAAHLLARWKKVWEQRPALVMPAPACGSEMQSNRQLAQHIANVGKLPLLDNFLWIGEAVPDNIPSTPHVCHLERTLKLTPPQQSSPGPVLLCATTARSCWTLTVAAAMPQVLLPETAPTNSGSGGR